MGIEKGILIIAPYQRSMELYRKTLQEKELDVDVIAFDATNPAGYKTFYDKVERLICNGKSIVIARGTMAEQIRNQFSVKVVALEVTDYDVLCALYKWRNCKRSFAVVECESFVSKALKIGNLLEMDIYPYVTCTTSEISQNINQAVKDGHNFIITGAWAEYHADFFTSHEIQYEMIECSVQAMEESVQRAINHYLFSKEEKEKKEMLNTIIECSPGAIIAVDRHGKITIFNDSAQKLFYIDNGLAIGRRLPDLFPQLSITNSLLEGKIIKNEIVHINQSEIVYDAVPLLVEGDLVGAILTLQRWKDLEESERKIRSRLAEKGLKAKYNFQYIIGSSKSIHDTVSIAKIFAETDSTVLITGETGTGKELFAQSIHNASRRKEAPFVAINCSALPENLLQSELFGYVDGAFTGARKGGKAGIFELAHTGTIFLDEIGEINHVVQIQLLRVIQEREIMRIGDDRIIPVDVRIIAATNRDLYHEMLENNFRSDLYFRLNVLNLHLVPLRERREDIPLMIDSILVDLNRRLQCDVKGLDSKLMQIFMSYDWPGNIRELQNAMEKVVTITRTGIADYKTIEPVIQDLKYQFNIQKDIPVAYTLGEQEKDAILRALGLEYGNKTLAAKRLGIHRSTLLRKIKKYNLVDN